MLECSEIRLLSSSSVDCVGTSRLKDDLVAKSLTKMVIIDICVILYPITD